MQSVFVCVYTPKQTFELIYIRLKPQAYVSHPAAYVWKIVCTWFVNFDLVCTDDIQQIVNLYKNLRQQSNNLCPRHLQTSNLDLGFASVKIACLQVARTQIIGLLSSVFVQIVSMCTLYTSVYIVQFVQCLHL